MLRSLMTAVTGVRAHQTMLDVTGNNIANVNTTGFKKDYTVFQDLLYQQTRGASGPSDNIGGINPMKVGLGTQVAAISTSFAPGPMTYTGNKTDMAIQGEGFFVFRNGESRLYSRAGNFTLDKNYNLVHEGTGYYVQGYPMERDPLNPTNFVMGSNLGDIRIPMGSKMEARATTVVGFKCNLDSRSESYLPIGFADIPFTNQNNEARVKIAGTSYDTAFTTHLTSADGTGYFSISLRDGANVLPIQFDMTGISGGLPVLSLQLTAVTLPDGTAAYASYDNNTGVFTLRDQTSGATLWETNLQQSMHYSSFTVNDSSATGGTYNFIGEFNEGDLNSSPVNLTLWYDDGNGNIDKAVVSVSFKADGTFDAVSSTLVEGTLPPGYTLGTNFKINIASSGRSLEIQAAKDSSVAANPSMQVVGQINQGGMHQTKVTVYDCQGNPYTMEVTYKKLTENRWRWEASFPSDGQLVATPSSGEITFGECGKIVTPPSVDIEVPFSLLGTQNEVIKLDFSGEAFGLDVMEGVTQYASPTTTKPYYQDGYAMGILNDFSTSQDGTIVGKYSNGQNVPLYRMSLAQFANPMGLDKVGNTMFSETVNSGMASIDAANVNGSGVINANNLEASNVDLTEEFTRLILAQRGFQANTRVVTTSDQILEEVVNMKR